MNKDVEFAQMVRGQLLWLMLVALGAAIAPAAAAGKQPPVSPPSASRSAGQASAPAAGNITLIQETVLLETGQTSGDGSLVVQLPANVQGPPQVADLGSMPSSVTLGTPVAAGNPAGRLWRIPVTVKGLAKFTTVKRRLLITAGEASEPLDYTVTNVSQDQFELNVLSVGGTVKWSDAEPMVATVMVGPVPAIDLTVNAVLSDDTTAQRFGGGALLLCANRTGKCEPVTTIGANTTQRLFVRPEWGVHPSPGKYTGSIELIASGHRSAASAVTVLVSDLQHKAVGVALLAFVSKMALVLT